MDLESTQSSDCPDWTDSKTLKLIDLFRQHECLWKVNTANFLTVAAAIIAAVAATTKSSDKIIQHGHFLYISIAVFPLNFHSCDHCDTSS